MPQHRTAPTAAPTAAEATPITIDFEDIDLSLYSFIPMPAGYAGFDWRDFGAFTPAPSVAGSGYETGINGDQGAYSLGGAPVRMIMERGVFTLESVQMTAGWNTQMTVDIYGFRNGAVIYHETVEIGDAGPTTVTLDFENVHKVKFVSSNGVDDPRFEGTGNHIVFDDIIVSDIRQRPDPAAFGEDAPAWIVPSPVHAGFMPDAGIAALA